MPIDVVRGAKYSALANRLSNVIHDALCDDIKPDVALSIAIKVLLDYAVQADICFACLAEPIVTSGDYKPSVAQSRLN